MELEDLEREIIKVTKQGGVARVPEEMVMESMDCPDETECRQQMEGWVTYLCAEYHLTRDQDKDMLGQTELLFAHVDPHHIEE
jgi:hypothetical protein